jgi:hypothetical protein
MMIARYAEPKPKATPIRVDWRRVEDIVAMTMVCLGQSDRRVLAKTKLTPSQLQYRKRKGRCRTSDYRNGNPGTLGGQIANKLLNKAMDEFQPVVEGRLQKSLPTKKEVRRLAHEGNGSRAVRF